MTTQWMKNRGAVRTIASARYICLTDNEQLKLIVGACAGMGFLIAVVIFALRLMLWG